MKKYLGIFVLFLMTGCVPPKPPAAKPEVQPSPPAPSRFEVTDTTPLGDWGGLCVVRDKKTEVEFLLWRADYGHPVSVGMLPSHK
jgi:hypothetical protein